MSQQARRGDRVREWVKEVKRVAEGAWDSDPPATGPLTAAITYFFDSTSFDVDYIPKPILDALKGMVFADDSQIFDLLCRKRDMNDNLQIQNPSPDLIDFLLQSRQVLHIAVSNALEREVSFW